MTNLELLGFSVKNPPPLLDEYYGKGKLVITQTATEKNALMRGNERLIELITVFKYLKAEKKNANDADISKIVIQVLEILDKVEGINFTAFSQFFMVHNSAHSSYLKFSPDKKYAFIYEMLCRFCDERHSIYLSHGYSSSMLQVVADNYSHKRNSKTTINKITDFLSKFDFTPAETLEEFESARSYFLPDKGGMKVFRHFKDKFAIEMKAAENEQGKLPDIVFNFDGDFFIVEAKMMKGAGGGQDKQLVEIINFIRYAERRKNVHYLTYLDGEYFEMLFAEKRSKKIQTQCEDIVACLKNCPQNYFVNPAGFDVSRTEKIQKK